MKESFLKKYKVEIFIFSLALIVRGGLFLINLYTNGGNLEATIHGQDGYYDVAKSLVNGDGFSAWKQLPTPFHVPLYPLFLASFLFLFGSFAPAAIAQVLISSSIPLLGRKIALKIFPSIIPFSNPRSNSVA